MCQIPIYRHGEVMRNLTPYASPIAAPHPAQCSKHLGIVAELPTAFEHEFQQTPITKLGIGGEFRRVAPEVSAVPRHVESLAHSITPWT